MTNSAFPAEEGPAKGGGEEEESESNKAQVEASPSDSATVPATEEEGEKEKKGDEGDADEKGGGKEYIGTREGGQLRNGVLIDLAVRGGSV